MKKKGFRPIGVLPAAVFCAIFLAGTPAFAEYLNVPGTNAQVVGTTATTPWLGSYVWPDGVKFFVSEGKTATVVYSIPSRSGGTLAAQQLKFRWRSNGGSGTIQKAVIYNGDTKVATINGPWTTNATWQTVPLDLGSAKTFGRGLSLVLTITGGTGSSFYWFSGAGVNFTGAP